MIQVIFNAIILYCFSGVASAWPPRMVPDFAAPLSGNSDHNYAQNYLTTIFDYNSLFCKTPLYWTRHFDDIFMFIIPMSIFFTPKVPPLLNVPPGADHSPRPCYATVLFLISKLL